ncbi:cell division protein FtsB [Vreelandella subglaciescola]|uniref:Cell division protein FtsB n=1 Tax=Vreelandella subglaciescola TaxID=29571 RepID=A0A1M7G1B1_9GAMM|nr:cell division protein FtsB [Halomonas subglaciescola]SHM09858.1 cell division protein FtsB [Halomonas subglaciescola]
MSSKTKAWPFRKWLVLGLLALLALLQYKLWLGRGGWQDLQQVQTRVDAQEAANAPMRERNARLAAEVRDLKTGLDAVEERARSDMGMVRADEQFFWVPGVSAYDTPAPQNPDARAAASSGEAGL